MNVKDLREAFADYPDDANVEIGKFLALDTENIPPKDAYEVRLDFPIIGIAHDEKSGDILFVVGGGGEKELSWLLKFSKNVRKIS